MRSLYVLAILLYSCARHDSGPTSLDIASAQAQRDHLCTSYDPTQVPRCDRATFHVLMVAMCGQPLPAGYESPSGKWNRDIITDNPCYPSESSSDTSRDTYMSLLLSSDKGAIQRSYTLASNNSGNTGQPSGGVGFIGDLLPTMRNEFAIRANSDDSTAIDTVFSTIQKVFTGDRGELATEWLWVNARLNGGMTSIGEAFIQTALTNTPSSPFFSCMAHRFAIKDNDQSSTLNLLSQIPQQVGDFGWGSSPWQVHYTMTVRCLEGG